jgi:hypothetical protein
MFLSAICRLSVPLAASIFRASIAVAETTTVGAVDKVQAQVEATQAGQTRPLAIGSDVYFRDRCHSREGARLQAKDGTQLTLGENATLPGMDFVHGPNGHIYPRSSTCRSIFRGRHRGTRFEVSQTPPRVAIA